MRNVCARSFSPILLSHPSCTCRFRSLSFEIPMSTVIFYTLFISNFIAAFAENARLDKGTIAPLRMKEHAIGNSRIVRMQQLTLIGCPYSTLIQASLPFSSKNHTITTIIEKMNVCAYHSSYRTLKNKGKKKKTNSYRSR